MGQAFLESREHSGVVSNLWIQGFAESAEDPEIRRYLRKHMREVHGYVADVIRRAQAAGGVPADRDPDAEAWIFLSIGLLSMADRCLGGLIKERWTDIVSARRRWMTGERFS
jgi:hypothetical protein